MIKTLKNLFKQDKEKFAVPKSVQAVIPMKTIWEDGIFLVGKNKYANSLTSMVDRVLRVTDGVLTDLGGNANEKLS